VPTECTLISRNHQDQSIKILYLSSSVVLLFCSKWYFLNQSQDTTVFVLCSERSQITVPQHNMFSCFRVDCTYQMQNIIGWRAIFSLIKRKFKLLLYQFFSKRIRFNVSAVMLISLATINNIILQHKHFT
jgi:hypothetical protein